MNSSLINIGNYFFNINEIEAIEVRYCGEIWSSYAIAVFLKNTKRFYDIKTGREGMVCFEFDTVEEMEKQVHKIVMS